jgi:hypothetical protein
MKFVLKYKNFEFFLAFALNYFLIRKKKFQLKNINKFSEKKNTFNVYA